MKHLKTYENVNKPQVGDYVAISTDEYFYGDESEKKKDFLKYLGNSVGKIVSKNAIFYNVKFDNSPIKYIRFFRPILIGKIGKSEVVRVREVIEEDILFHSKNKEDVEIFLNSKKYNV